MSEKEPLLQSDDASEWQKMSKDGLPQRSTSGGNETPAAYRSRIKSLNVILVTNFLSATGFSLLLPSMWQYFQSMGGTTNLLGYLVGAFSIGQLFGAPFWGYYSTKRSYAETLNLTIIVRMLGNIFYAMVCVMPLSNGDKFYALVGSRIFVGFGAGSMAVCNAYVAGATTLEERLKWMGFTAGTGGLGFIFGPLIGSAFGGMQNYSWKYLELNFMTMPALFASLLCIVNILLIYCSFKQHILNKPIKTESRKSHSVQHESSSAQDKHLQDVESRDYVAVSAILVIYFLQYCLFAVFETIGLPLMEDEYGWSAKRADVISGLISGFFGVQSVVMFLCTQLVAKKIGHRPTLMTGLLIVVISQLVTIPWAGPPTESAECRYKWCDNDHELPLPQYIFGLFLVYVGFPLANVMIFTIYSKVLGPAPQGTWMGLINSFGSLARTVGPMAISNMYAFGGPYLTYMLSTGFVGGALTVTLLVKHRFLVFGSRKRMSVLYENGIPAAPDRAQVYEDDATIKSGDSV